MPDPNWQPESPGTKNPFMRKLGTYLTGVAIGFLLLGWFQYRKGIAAQQQRQRLLSEAEQDGSDLGDTPVATDAPEGVATEPSP